jgi:hypothetical protein
VLREIVNVKQEVGAGRRRWFESEGLDVVVWLASDNSVDGFQLCYDVGQGDHALTWRVGTGFAHNRIDGGEPGPFSNLTPILQPAGPVPWSKVIALYRARCASLEPGLHELIEAKLVGDGSAGRC